MLSPLGALLERATDPHDVNLPGLADHSFAVVLASGGHWRRPAEPQHNGPKTVL